MTLLSLEAVGAGYGKVTALHDVDLRVEAGEIVTLIGANGAGKTTLLRTISGLVPSRTGRITFDGQDITRLPPHAIVRSGLVHVPEGRLVLKKMSVRENLLGGAHVRDDRDAVGRDMEAVVALFPVLGERMEQQAGMMSGGEQQMLAIGRALLAAPRLLMLDEPSLGLAPIIVDRVLATIREIRDRGVTILLVEQNARKALAVSDRAYVLTTGRIVLSGTAKAVAEDAGVIEAYLGA